MRTITISEFVQIMPKSDKMYDFLRRMLVFYLNESRIFTNVFGTIVLTGSANGAGDTTILNLEIGTYLVLIEGGFKN